MAVTYTVLNMFTICFPLRIASREGPRIFYMNDFSYIACSLKCCIWSIQFFKLKLKQNLWFSLVALSKKIIHHQNSSVIWQKDESQNGGKRTCAYREVKNVRFSENVACFVFWLPPFWNSPFCHITDELSDAFSFFWYSTNVFKWKH